MSPASSSAGAAPVRPVRPRPASTVAAEHAGHGHDGDRRTPRSGTTPAPCPAGPPAGTRPSAPSGETSTVLTPSRCGSSGSQTSRRTSFAGPSSGRARASEHRPPAFDALGDRLPRARGRASRRAGPGRTTKASTWPSMIHRPLPSPAGWKWAYSRKSIRAGAGRQGRPEVLGRRRASARAARKVASCPASSFRGPPFSGQFGHLLPPGVGLPGPGVARASVARRRRRSPGGRRTAGRSRNPGPRGRAAGGWPRWLLPFQDGPLGGEDVAVSVPGGDPARGGTSER